MTGVKGRSGIYKRKPLTDEHRKNIGLGRTGIPSGMLGKKHKAKTRKLMSLRHKGKQYSLGVIRSKETRDKISIGLKKRYDEKGRKNYKRYIHLTATKEYKEWRTSVFERDNYTCKCCNERGVYIEADHIKSWAYYPELRFEVSNGQTLCRPCHRVKTNEDLNKKI